PGRADQDTLTIDLSANVAPADAKALVIEAQILGQKQVERIEKPLPATWRFTWNAEDAYGRSWQGREQAELRVGFVYDGVYERTTRFGASGNGIPITGDRARSEVTLWGNWSGPLGGISHAATGLGGWDFDVHDVLDADGGVLYRGDGSQSNVER